MKSFKLSMRFCSKNVDNRDRTEMTHLRSVSVVHISDEISLKTGENGFENFQ